jgi:hypothetical protein
MMDIDPGMSNGVSMGILGSRIHSTKRMPGFQRFIEGGASIEGCPDMREGSTLLEFLGNFF